MLDFCITIFHCFHCCFDRRFDCCSTTFRNRFNLFFNSVFVFCFGNWNDPCISVIKRYHSYIVFLPKLRYCIFCRCNCQIQIRLPVIHDLGHTSGMIDDHDHCHARRFIGSPRFHIYRKECFQFRIPVTAQRKAFFSSTTDQTTSIIFYIRIQIIQKLLRQIRAKYIVQHNALVCEHII